LLALGIVMLYVAFRFQFKFSVGAVVALIHDVLIVLGIFALFGLDFDLTVLAAVLAVIGYSLNDSIVVSDRIRENFRIMRTNDPLKVMNDSINQTLSRTVATSTTTLLVLLALLFLGGELIHNFALALTIGVAVGTYSSIYVVTMVLLMMNISRDDLIIAMPEEEEDGRP
jgi:preprotein translocase subunit SecF